MNHREFVTAMGEGYQAELVRKCRAYADLMAETIEEIADAVTDEDMADPDRAAELAADVLDMKQSGVRALDAADGMERGELTDDVCEDAERFAGLFDECRASNSGDL